MEAHSSLERTQHIVVLDAVSLKNFMFTVFALDREIDDEFVHWFQQDASNLLVHVDGPSGSFDVGRCLLVEAG